MNTMLLTIILLRNKVLNKGTKKLKINIQFFGLLSDMNILKIK